MSISNLLSKLRITRINDIPLEELRMYDQRGLLDYLKLFNKTPTEQSFNNILHLINNHSLNLYKPQYYNNLFKALQLAHYNKWIESLNKEMVIAYTFSDYSIPMWYQKMQQEGANYHNLLNMYQGIWCQKMYKLQSAEIYYIMKFMQYQNYNEVLLRSLKHRLAIIQDNQQCLQLYESKFKQPLDIKGQLIQENPIIYSNLQFKQLTRHNSKEQLQNILKSHRIQHLSLANQLRFEIIFDQFQEDKYLEDVEQLCIEDVVFLLEHQQGGKLVKLILKQDIEVNSSNLGDFVDLYHISDSSIQQLIIGKLQPYVYLL